jgi:hypothetical protein
MEAPQPKAGYLGITETVKGFGKEGMSGRKCLIETT